VDEELDAEPQGEAEEEGVGSLGAALLSAGFGSDGSLPEVEPEMPQAPEPAPTAAPAVKPRKVSKPRPAKPKPVVEPPATTEVAELVEEEPISPYDKPGSWYVIHAYSGYEKKVKTRLATRTSSMHMEDRIFEVVIPTEKVVEIKGGRKVEVEKRMFPGYLLIRMYLDDDSWHAVRNTPGVTSFVGMGTGNKPTSLSKREVERFLGLKKEAAKKPPRFRPAWEIGETVRVSSGPFADFNGVVEDINVDRQKVTVLVEIFGRDTPMELGFEEIQKQ
jgi:transcriptional antiterminator NusG